MLNATAAACMLLVSLALIRWRRFENLGPCKRKTGWWVCGPNRTSFVGPLVTVSMVASGSVLSASWCRLSAPGREAPITLTATGTSRALRQRRRRNTNHSAGASLYPWIRCSELPIARALIGATDVPASGGWLASNANRNRNSAGLAARKKRSEVADI